jgi:hypothetical protein
MIDPPELTQDVVPIQGELSRHGAIPGARRDSRRGRRDVLAGADLLEKGAAFSGHESFLAEDVVQRPTASHMRAGRAQMGQQVGVGAASLFQGVRQNREACEVEVPAREVAVFVGSFCE